MEAKHPITALHVVGGLSSTGGVMRVAMDLARAMPPHTRSFVWKHRDFAPGQDVNLFICDGRVEQTDVSAMSDLLSVWREVGPLVRWIRAEKNVVLHAHSRLGVLASCIASKITGCPLVIHFHALWRRKWIYRKVVKWSGATPIFNSVKTCRYFGFDPAKSVVLMPSIQWPQGPPIAKGVNRFISVGSFVEWKNFRLTIEAFNQMSAGGAAAELVLFGRTNRPVNKKDQDSIVSLARANPGICIREHDVDWVSQLSENDVFVHAAEQEPFGIVILEAFAKGCRCVVAEGTFLDDLPEPIRSRWIYRVSPMNASELREQMLKAMAERQTAGDLWNGRRAVAKAFSVHEAVIKVSAIYDSVLHSTNIFGE